MPIQIVSSMDDWSDELIAGLRDHGKTGMCWQVNNLSTGSSQSLHGLFVSVCFVSAVSFLVQIELIWISVNHVSVLDLQWLSYFEAVDTKRGATLDRLVGFFGA